MDSYIPTVLLSWDSVEGQEQSNEPATFGSVKHTATVLFCARSAIMIKPRSRMEPSKESFEATQARIKDLPPPVVSNPMRRSKAEARHVCNTSCECDRCGCKCDVCKRKSRNEKTGRCVVRHRAAAMPSMADLLRVIADFLHPEGGDDMEEDGGQ